MNTAHGYFALYNNTSGHGNTANGGAALYSNTTGHSNTANGLIALYNNGDGIKNTAIGVNSLVNNTSGSYNTVVGANADVSSGSLNNATAIGFNAIVDASDKIRLGDANVTVIEGQVAFTASSDRNKKENFHPVDGDEVLRKLSALELTSWNYIGHDPAKFRHYGPMAQDFFAAFGDDGVGQIGNDTTINSGDMAGILMIAVQALERRTADLKAKDARIAALEREVAEMIIKQSLLETIAARFEALELKLNNPLPVRADITAAAQPWIACDSLPTRIACAGCFTGAHRHWATYYWSASLQPFLADRFLV